MKWIYFYTPDYIFWHTHLQSSLSKSFELEAIEVAEINAVASNGKHHFHGITLKIDLVIKKIQENMGRRIVFSDCTLWANHSMKEQLFVYLSSIQPKYDLALADNGLDRTANIGLILINCNQRSLRFFLHVRKKMAVYKWDQEAVNMCLPGSWILRVTKLSLFHLILPFCKKIRSSFTRDSVKWTILDSKKIICGLELPENIRQSYYVYKQFITPSNKIDNWNQRISKLFENGLIDDSVRSKNLKSDF